MSGAALVTNGMGIHVGWITDNPGAVNITPSNEQVKITNFSLISGVANPTVTYNGNGSDGGTVPTDGSSPYTHSATVTVLGAGTMTRTGFNFIGWNTASDGSGTNYSPAATFTIYDNTTLYAKWLPNTLVTLTYDGNGNTGGSAPVDANSPYTSGPPPPCWAPAALPRPATPSAAGTPRLTAAAPATAPAPPSPSTPTPRSTPSGRPARISSGTTVPPPRTGTRPMRIGAEPLGATPPRNNAFFTTGGGNVYLDPASLPMP